MTGQQRFLDRCAQDLALLASGQETGWWDETGRPPPGPRASGSSTTPSTSTGTPQTTGKRSSRPTITPSDFHINHEGSRNRYTTPRDLTGQRGRCRQFGRRSTWVHAQAFLQLHLFLRTEEVVDEGGIHQQCGLHQCPTSP